MTHLLKITPEYYEDVRTKGKRFEVRKDDRVPRYEVGDTLVLQEYKDGAYTGKEIFVRVNYIYRGEIGLQSGYCVLGFERLIQPQ